MPGRGADPLLTSGTVVAQYEFQHLLGRGGMGEVYLAQDTRLDRPVAIKVIRRSLLGDVHTRARFVREGRAASSVVHPYVATVFDVVERGDEIFLVMEYIEGLRLNRYLAEAQPSMDKRLRLAREIGEALAAIHGQGLVHRDLKPANVIVTPAGHVKVLDFGLAFRTGPLPSSPSPEDGETVSRPLTSPGAVVGTVAYMSPEQLRSENVDARSDLFSLGILLYEMATGEHPFHRATQVDTVSAILHEAPGGGAGPDVLQTLPGLREVLARTLAKSCEDRYPSAETMVVELETLITGERTSSVQSLQRRRRFGVALTATALILAVLGMGAYLSLRGPPAWDAPRFSLAVVPLADRTGEPDGILRASMVADLLTADLESSQLIRVVGPGETVPLLKSLPAGSGPAEQIRRVSAVMEVDYLVAGTLYREGERYLATLNILPTGNGAEVPAVRAKGATATALAERLAGAVRRSLPDVPPLTALRDDRTDLTDLTSESEEARLLYERGVIALQDGKLGEAIERFEEAVRIDPDFALAHARLSEALATAGYSRRAREEAALALDRAPPPRSAATRRLGLVLRDYWARAFDRPEEAVEVAGTLSRLYPDEPALRGRYASALAEAGRVEEAVMELDLALDREPARAALHRLRGEVFARAGRFDRALESLAEAERFYRLVGSDEGLAVVTAERGRVFKQQDEYVLASAELSRAVEGFTAAGQEVLAIDTLLEAAQVDVLRGEARAAGERLRTAEETARRVGNLGLLCRALSGLGAQHFVRGEYPAAERHMREAVDLGRRLQNDHLLVSPLSNLGSLMAYTGRQGEARPLIVEARDLARAMGRKDLETSALVLLAGTDAEAGDLEAALIAYRRVIALSRAQDDPALATPAAWARLGLARIHEEQGRMAAALEAAEGAVEEFQRLSAMGNLGYALLRRGTIRINLGRMEEGRSDLAASRDIARSSGSGLEELVAWCALGETAALAQEESWKQMAREARKVLALPGPARPRVTVAAHLALCRAQSRMGQFDEAMEACRLGAGEAQVGAPIRTVVRSHLAEALAGARQYEAARQTARAALEEAEGMGLLLPVARTAAVLASLPEAWQPQDAEALRDHGGASLEAYLVAVPGEDRPAVRRQADLRHLRTLLEEGEK